MKVCEQHAGPGQGVQVRRIDLSTKRTDIGIAHVVSNDEQNIGPPIGRAAGLSSGQSGRQKGEHYRRSKCGMHQSLVQCSDSVKCGGMPVEDLVLSISVDERNSIEQGLWTLLCGSDSSDQKANSDIRSTFQHILS